MHSMAIDRRSFIQAVAAVGAADFITPALAGFGEDGIYVSGCRQGDGSFAAVLFDARGQDIAVLPVETRLHDTTYSHVLNRAVIFARRPGTLAFVIDLGRREIESTIVSPIGRHFYGHGVFSSDGRILYATENDVASGEGRIGLYDSSDGYRRIGEIHSGGVGPHELLLHPDGSSLVVANGGIRTNPETGREKLDLDTMVSSLARISLEHGDITELVELPKALRRLSLRHLSVDGTGIVWFGARSHCPSLPELRGISGDERARRPRGDELSQGRANHSLGGCDGQDCRRGRARGWLRHCPGGRSRLCAVVRKWNADRLVAGRLCSPPSRPPRHPFMGQSSASARAIPGLEHDVIR
jgi:hypothetical protein